MEQVIARIINNYRLIILGYRCWYVCVSGRSVSFLNARNVRLVQNV